ncbi:MAG: hypothetical protein IIU58_06495, partial [Clostridia bacterium]|nr:hypothetical protein [Clostridia bacterium]
MTVVRLDDGNTVLKASKVYSYSAQWRMITFNLTTTEGTGLTKAFPGKYELKLRYFIDNTDKSKYASITGRIGLDGKYPSTGSGRGIGTGFF